MNNEISHQKFQQKNKNKTLKTNSQFRIFLWSDFLKSFYHENEVIKFFFLSNSLFKANNYIYKLMNESSSPFRGSLLQTQILQSYTARKYPRKYDIIISREREDFFNAREAKKSDNLRQLYTTNIVS